MSRPACWLAVSMVGMGMGGGGVADSNQVPNPTQDHRATPAQVHTSMAQELTIASSDIAVELISLLEAPCGRIEGTLKVQATICR
jgi:hypothetical protein